MAWARLERIFGPADGSFGAGVMQLIDRGSWKNQSDLGASYIDSSAHIYNADGTSEAAKGDFETRVKSADAFVHIQDNREIDLLTGGDGAAHEGGFAAAAASVGNDKVSLYHGDTGTPDVGTPDMYQRLDAVKWEMLDEWSRTRRAPKHAHWMHEKELG